VKSEHLKAFMDENFVLQTETAQYLYHEHAKNLPIIDYHCHLNPEFIAKDRKFDNLGQIWLEGDHYKWRAMRTNGIDERFCTGDASDWEKFEKWAETVPYTMRNPLYHWTHLELKTAFGVTKLLRPETAQEIYDHCTAQLRTPEYSARGLMKRYNVEAVCTTDDPVDSLEHHIALKKENFSTKVLPTWRPDKAMAVNNAADYRAYLEKLSEVSDIHIRKYQDLLEALRVRHDFFASVGCKLSDHGIEEFYAEDYTPSEINAIFNKVYDGKTLTKEEIRQFQSAILVEFAVLDWEKGWVQQFHYGTIRNNNTRMFNQLGADTGFDSIGDFTVAKNMAKFFDRLNVNGKLTKTIIYNLNPRDNDLIATMIGNFQDGTVAGKMQFGSGWWFLDQKNGMEAQINSLSVLGLLSRFVGMLTDSRSFLSYPRHEYFRRILCNLIGNDVEQGLLPSSEIPFLSELVENVSYYNAKRFFDF
jgi:glucuronate isomerase